jgi:hypothetical protein
MAYITAADLTTVIKERFVAGRKRYVIGTLAIPGTLKYPNGGIPLPVKATLGMIQQVDSFVIFGVDPTAGTVADYLARYDKTNHTLFLYVEEAVAAGGPLLEAIDNSEAPGARTYDFLCIGW